MRNFILIACITCLSLTAIAQDIPKPTKPPLFDSDRAPENCTFKGYNMNARVKIVFPYNSATFRVKVLKDNEGGEDLTVRFVTNSRTWNMCGQWEIVDSREDFSVAFVETQEDFTIRITE